MTGQLSLRLYVAGLSRYGLTVDAVRHFVAESDSDAELVVIDVLADPAAAERDGVLAVPLLVLAGLDRERRVVGQFFDANDVREALEL